MTDYTSGENSIKKYKLNVNQRRKDNMNGAAVSNLDSPDVNIFG
ncbi:hypothetical protein [Peribacillus frigoritolerans]|nr:hypothetical protein [Peribacillus frigoritolerans]